MIRFGMAFISAIAAVIIASASLAQESLNEHFEPLRPLLGKTWKGKFIGGENAAPQYDVSRWERAMNGQAIRILHSVNNGAYGGETIIVWDAEKNSLIFYYFTTAGFYTTGTMSYANGKFESHEKVSPVHNGITEVKAVGELLPDGKMRSKAQFLQNGQWVDGHEILYEEAPGAEVIFK